MSKISETFWNLVEGSAPKAAAPLVPARGWKFLRMLGPKGAQATITELQSQCAAKGLPQPAFKTLNIGKANAEIDRLRDVLSGAPPTSIHIAPSVAAFPGSPGPSLPTAAPGPATHTAAVAVHVVNTEPNTATPAAVPPGPIVQASAELLAKRDFVFACWDSVAGTGRSAIACQRPTFRDDLSSNAGLFEGDIAAAAFSESAAKRVRQARSQAATSRIANGWTTAAVQEDINKIVAEALSFGLRIPGQSVKGMKIPVNSQPLTHNRLVAAQKMLNDFAAALSGDDDAGVSTAPAAQKAREFYQRQTGREFRVGATIQPRKL